MNDQTALFLTALPANLTSDNITSTTISSEVRGTDIILILVYLFCGLVGLPGNVLAVCYFTRSATKKDLSSSLYTAVAIVDVLVCVMHLPVMISLMSGRKAVFFQYSFICTSWRLIFKTLQRLTVFMVLLLSISRTISLTRPLAVINKNMVLGFLYGYMVYIALEMAVLGSRERYAFDAWGVYCYECCNGQTVSNIINTSMYIISLGAPAIVIFISFVISVAVIRKSMVPELWEEAPIGNSGSASANPLKRHATTTIMIFTLTYIVCNIPHFVNMVMFILTMTVFGGYPGPFYNGFFMTWYSWNISDVLSVLLNSAINPIIYFFRISLYQSWIKELNLLKYINWKI